MTPRRLPLDPDTLALLRPESASTLAPVSPLRKTFAVALHAGCLSLFGLLVVWPVVAPLAGELPREIRPVLETWSQWAANWSLPDLEPAAGGGGRHGCAPVCSHVYVR